MSPRLSSVTCWPSWRRYLGDDRNPERVYASLLGTIGPKRAYGYIPCNRNYGSIGNMTPNLGVPLVPKVLVVAEEALPNEGLRMML